MIATILARIYNYCRPSHDSQNSLQRDTMGSSTPSSTFCYDELRRALSEQSFGIKSYTMAAATSQSASAAVFLLEGQKVVISLEHRGYFVDCDKSVGISCSSEQGYHETLENLLRSISFLYAERHQETIFAALEKLSQS